MADSLVNDGGHTPLGDALRACRRAFVAAGLFSAASSILLLIMPIYTIQVIDRVLTSRSLDTLGYLTLLVAMVLALLGALDRLRASVLTRASLWIERKLGAETFERSVEAQLFGRPQRGQPLRDLTTLRSFLGSSGIISLFDAPWAPIFIVALFIMSPIIGGVALFGALIIVGLGILNEIWTREPLDEANALAVTMLARADAAARNAEAIDAMGMMRRFVDRWEGENREVLARQWQASERSALITSFARFLRLMLQILVMGLGAYLVIDEQLTPGAMMAGSIIVARALAPLDHAITTWKYVGAARVAYRRLKSHLERPPMRRMAMALPPPRGAVAVEAVYHVAPGTNRRILTNVSCTLGPGQSMAVIGSAGAGKTTLARLLCGLAQPSSGRVRLDGADVFTWPREDFGQHIGYLPQGVELFAGTIRENIARLSEGDPAGVVEAAERAGAHDMILRLPEGYETEVGEGGQRLSAGQRQRVALARAVYGRPRLVVLDEPNAHLDSDGEGALLNCLKELKAMGASVVVITHRANILRHVDRILHLQQGAVSGFGPSAEIIAQLTRSGVARMERPGGGTAHNRAGGAAMALDREPETPV